MLHVVRNNQFAILCYVQSAFITCMQGLHAKVLLKRKWNCQICRNRSTLMKYFRVLLSDLILSRELTFNKFTWNRNNCPFLDFDVLFYTRNSLQKFTTIEITFRSLMVGFLYWICDGPHALFHGVFISQLVRYVRVIFDTADYNARIFCLQKLEDVETILQRWK